MLEQLQNPQYLEGLATGVGLGLIAGMAIMAALFFVAEARRDAREKREARERAARLRAAETAQRWPEAANDDRAALTGSSTPRAELRRAPR